MQGSVSLTWACRALYLSYLGMQGSVSLLPGHARLCISLTLACRALYLSYLGMQGWGGCGPQSSLVGQMQMVLWPTTRHSNPFLQGFCLSHPRTTNVRHYQKTSLAQELLFLSKVYYIATSLRCLKSVKKLCKKYVLRRFTVSSLQEQKIIIKT